MAERKIKQWITINGVHVPIYEGESKEDAAKRAISKAQENRKKDDDQKEKDIQKNKDARQRLEESNALVDEQNEIINKYGADSPEYAAFKKKAKAYIEKDKAERAQEAANKESKSSADKSEQKGGVSDKYLKKMNEETNQHYAGKSWKDTSKMIKDLDDNDGVKLTAVSPDHLTGYQIYDDPDDRMRYDFYLEHTKDGVRVKEAKISNPEPKNSFKNATAGKASDAARVKTETKSSKSKKPIDSSKYNVHNYTVWTGRTKTTTKEAMKKMSDLVEQSYSRAMKNYWGETPPAKQMKLDSPFNNIRWIRDEEYGDVRHDKALAKFTKDLRDRYTYLVNEAEKYTVWDNQKREWVKKKIK